MIAYESKWCVIYEGSCLDVLPMLEQADLLVTDPPYGIRFRSGFGENHPEIEGDGDTSAAAAMLSAVNVREARHCYMFWSPKVSRPDADAAGFQGWTPLIWDKCNLGMGGSSCWSTSHEEILFSVKIRSRAGRKRGSGNGAARLRRSSVLRHKRANSGGTRRHPTEKPVPLLRDLVESSSRPGEVVLDPFAGSGSTLVAAILEGRRCVGIEIDPGHVATAIARVRAAESVANSWLGL